jgi:protein involved in polysaccharide export with SLBB domain
MKKFNGLKRTGSRRWVTLFCLGIGLAAAVQSSLGQRSFPDLSEERNPLKIQRVPQAGDEKTTSPIQPPVSTAPQTTGQALEGPVDPTAYRLGPGDLIGMHVLGEVDTDLCARVSADGILRLPTIGVFTVGNRIFAEVKIEILAAAQRSYRSQQMAVTLLELRSFKASVGGMVQMPGTYVLTPIDRVSSLLSSAGGFHVAEKPEEREQTELGNTWREASRKNELPAYSTRRLQLIHRDGSAQNVDFLLFLRAGRPEGNPFLQDGDFLLAPPLAARTGMLGVYGAVNHQGVFEYLPGDDLQRALLLAGDLTAEARRDSVEITRFSDDQAGYTTFCVCLDEAGTLNTALQPDDRVFIRPRSNYHPRLQVELCGEFVKPGFYPVGRDGMPLTEILNVAGGFTPRASLREAVLRRSLGLKKSDPELDRLRALKPADMTALEYQYYKISNQETKGQVAVDLHALWMDGDSSANVLLRDGDRLEVPAITRTVKVSGQVYQPGLVTWEPGKDHKYYIEKCGGYSWHANKGKTRIIKGVSGQWVKPGNSPVEEGDTVFIPEKGETNWWFSAKDAIMVLAQVATIYLVIQTVK